MTALWISATLFVLVVVIAMLWFWMPTWLAGVGAAVPPARHGRGGRGWAWWLLLLTLTLSAMLALLLGGQWWLSGGLLVAGLGLGVWYAGRASIAPVPPVVAAGTLPMGLLDAIPLALAQVDAQRRMVQVNQALLDLLDTPRSTLAAGTPVSRLMQLLAERCVALQDEVLDLQQPVQQLDSEWLQSLLQRGQPDSDGFVRIRAERGRCLGLRLQVLPDAGWLMLIADLSERQRIESALRDMDQATRKEVDRRTRELRLARQEAEQANVSRTRFLTAASHDLLQPMNAARLLAGTLADHHSADAFTTETARRIEEAIVAAESILDALLEAGRLDAAAVKPRIATITLARMFDALSAQFAPVAARRKLRLRLRGTSLQVLSDKVLLQRLLSNLLSNALRYTQRGGVLVAARRRGEQVLIQVFDTGPGIDAEQQQLIFNEFRTGRNESPWGERGVGLGLALCRRTATLLMHEFGVSSVSGRGSCFHLSVPYAGTMGVQGKVVVEAPSADRLEHLRVLCIDDDTHSLAALCGLLRNWGVAVCEAQDFRRAREQLSAFEPQVLLVDYLLDTDLDGFDVITELRRLSGNELPAAVLSATRSDFLRDQAESRHCELFLKPVKPALLKAWLSLLPVQ